MCRGAKPLLNEDIYRLRENISVNEISNMNLLSLATGPCDPILTNTAGVGKWMCEACTYTNSVKDHFCTQCRNVKPTISLDNVNTTGKY